MKMQIKSLRVVDCGPLRDVLIDFTSNGKPRQTTLLGGANGSGKTTVLELIVSMANAVQSSGSDLPSIHTQAVYAMLTLLVDDSPLAIEVGVRPHDQKPPDDVIHLYGKDSGFPPSASSNGQMANKLLTTAMTQSLKPLELEQLRTEPSSVGSVIYLSHQRSIVSNPGNQINRETTRYEFALQNHTPTGFEGTLDSYLIWLEYAEPDTYRRMVDFLNSLDFDGKIFGVSRRNLMATVTTRDGHVHGLSQLSSGEQNIIEILLGLYRHLLPYSIVLIDEIENSLHPAFQYKIALGLKKLQEDVPFQLVVTSHAPAFLKVFGPENTLVLGEPLPFATTSTPSSKVAR